MATDTVDGGERRARGCERESGRGERCRQGGSERGSGRLRGVVLGVEAVAGSRRWSGVRRCASGTRRASDWREEEDLPAPGGLGRPDGLPGERQVSAFSLSLF